MFLEDWKNPSKSWQIGADAESPEATVIIQDLFGKREAKIAAEILQREVISG